MSKRKKKTPSRRGRKPKTTRKKSRRWLAGIWRLVLLACGVAVGLLLPWMIYLNHQVTSEFEGRKWDLPSRVYARSLELYPGLAMTPGDFEVELQRAAYHATGANRAGSYARQGGNAQRLFTIHRRAFDFPDGHSGEQRVSVRFAGSRIERIRDLKTGEDRNLFRLDPAEIASIYPLQKEDRTVVRIKDVPPLLITGLQAVEDRNFKHHHGVDLKGIGRAVIANLKAGQAVQGGSTITQQLVKNFFLSRDRTYIRKINEALMALLLEYHYEKSEILEAYINEVFIGQQGAYAIHGFGRASQFYFDQPLQQLEAHQIALLIGLVKGPSYYNPRRHPQRATSRRNQVLSMLAETGILDDSVAKEQAARSLGVTDQARSRGGRYTAFVDLVRRQLSQVYREDDLKTEGLRIFTTLSPSEQEKAQSAVSRSLRDLASRGLPSDLQGALVMADVASGEVRALVGDREPGRAGFNRAIHARRQVGSVIKPLVYLLALEHPTDYNLLTRIDDEPLTLRQPDGSNWSPDNYDRTSHGSVTLLEALTRSYNQATVRLGMNIGVNHLVNRIQQLGVDAAVDAVPSAFLGAVELTPLEVTQIYQSLAAGGYSVPLRAVLAVQTSQGDDLVRYPLRILPQSRREAIAVLNYALTEVVEQGTAKALPGLLGQDVTIAGKTGTTNDRRDSWFVGYTRNRVAVSWVGLDDNRPAGVTGSNAAMRVWAGFMQQLPLESVDLRVPDGAFWLWVDGSTGQLTGEHCPRAVQIPFVDGSEPTEATECFGQLENGNKESFWRKWFGEKN